MVGCSASLFCSCRKACGTSYEPPMLTDGQFSGAGYASGFTLAEDELVFTISGQSDASVLLTVRGRGESTVEINVNGDSVSLAFDNADRWQEVTAPLRFHPGYNSVIIKPSGPGNPSLMIDCIYLH